MIESDNADKAMKELKKVLDNWKPVKKLTRIQWINLRNNE